MDGQPLIPINNNNESNNPNLNLNQNLNQQQFNQIPINTNNMGQIQVQPQLVAYPQQQSFILPPQIDYSQYTNITQLNHTRIEQIGDNTFVIKKSCCEKTSQIVNAPLFFMLSIVFFWSGIYFGVGYQIFFAILYLAIAIIYFIMLFIAPHTINFILGENIITVEEIAWLKKKITVYLPGQLISVQLICQLTQECGTQNNYKINFLINNNGVSSQVIYFEEKIIRSRHFYTPEEMGYFNYVMNKHIQTKMMVKNVNNI